MFGQRVTHCILLSLVVFGAAAYAAVNASSTARVQGKTPDEAWSNLQADGLGFSTSTVLTNGATADSGILSLVGYTQVQTHVLSDVNGTITVDFIRDQAGTDILRTLTIPYTGVNNGGSYQMFSAPAFTPYVRYRFTATEAGMADFYFDTKFTTKAISPQILGVDAFVSPLMVATLGRSVISGRTDGGVYKNVGIDGEGHLHTAIVSPLSAFSELLTATPKPLAQVSFEYGLQTSQVVNTNGTGSGTISTTNALLSVSTGAATNSSAYCETKRFLKYRPGQGALARFTAMFTAGAAGSTQYAGPHDDDNGMAFGFQDQNFGLIRRSGGTDSFVAQTNWSLDVMDGTGSAANPSGILLDPEKLNVYAIKFQFLGAGAITYYVEDPSTGLFVPVHVIEYANANTEASLQNPSMPMRWEVSNSTNATDLVISAASGALFTEGEVRYLGYRGGYDATETSLTSATNAVTFKVASTFNGIANKSIMRVRNVTFGANTGGAGSGIAKAVFKKNCSLAGASFAAYDGSTGDDGVTVTGQSSVSVDTAASHSAGTTVYSMIVAVGNSASQDITDLDIFVAPGEVLTLELSSSQSCTAGIAIVFSEDQ